MNQQIEFAEMKNGPFKLFEDEEGLHDDLNEHIKSLGFEIGVRDVVLLSEEEFVASRHKGFGGSDGAVLLGTAYESKKVQMKTPEELYNEKLNEESDPSIGQLAPVRKGKELEDAFIEKASIALEASIIKPRHSYTDKKGLAMNFDGVVIENGEPIPLEIKLATTFGRSKYNFDKALTEFDEDLREELHKWEPDLKEMNRIYQDTSIQHHIVDAAHHFGVPPYYYVQIQQEMYFLNSTHSYLCVMDELKWTLNFFKIPRDETVISELQKKAYHWYLRLASIKNLPIEMEETGEFDI